MSDLDAVFFSPAERTSRAVDEMLIDYHRNRPRNLQQELGPSEVGHACARKIAYGLMREPRCNPDGDPLPSFVGTESHEGMKRAAEYANEKLGRTRWLAEERVSPEGLPQPGSCDLIDLDTWTIVDYKFLGATRIKDYTRNMPATVPVHYRRQVHLYGAGARRKGYPIAHVMIIMFPRGGLLSAKRTFSEPYSQDIVNEAVERLASISVSLDVLGVEANPAAYAAFPATPDDDCKYCPWWSPNPRTSYQCDSRSIGSIVPDPASGG